MPGDKRRYGASFDSIRKDVSEPVVISSAEKIVRGSQQRKRVTGLLQNQDGTFVIDLNNRLLTVTDTQATPVVRVNLGQIGALSTDYGLEIFDSSGAAIISITGLGVDSVGTAQIQDDAVTTVKVIDTAIIEAKIADSAITTIKINALAVTDAEIAANAVITSKIAALAVTAAEIGNNAVTTAKIAALAVTATEIGNLAVTTAKINALAVTQAQIATDAIITRTIIANAVTTVEIANNTIVAGNIVANTITAAEIAALTITAAEIAAETITASEIAASTIVAGNIAANTITASEIAAETITAAEIVGNTITAAEIAALTITASEIAANAITTVKINADAVTANEINVGTLSAISADIGTVTAGIVRDASSELVLDLNNALLAVNDSTQDRVLLGQVTASVYGLRLLDSTGTVIFQADSGIADDSIIINATNIAIGSDAQLSSFATVSIGSSFAGVSPAQLIIEGTSEADAINRTLYGINIGAELSTGGFNGQNAIGIISAPALLSTTGNYNRATALWARMITGSVTITTLVGVHIDPTPVGATITNSIGLDVENIDQGTNNWAILTGTGQVEFGDAVIHTSTTDLQGAITAGGILTGTSGRVRNTRQQATSVTLTNADDIVYANGGTITITLPPSPVEGQRCTIVHTAVVGGTVTVARNGNLIDNGTANLSLSFGGHINLIYDATNSGWWTV